MFTKVIPLLNLQFGFFSGSVNLYMGHISLSQRDMNICRFVSPFNTNPKWLTSILIVNTGQPKIYMSMSMCLFTQTATALSSNILVHVHVHIPGTCTCTP